MAYDFRKLGFVISKFEFVEVLTFRSFESLQFFKLIFSILCCFKFKSRAGMIAFVMTRTCLRSSEICVPKKVN